MIFGNAIFKSATPAPVTLVSLNQTLLSFSNLATSARPASVILVPARGPLVELLG